MKDTSSQMSRKFQEMMREKTPVERLAMGCDMFDFSKMLVKSRLLQERKGMSEDQLRQELFLRFYGNDFKEPLKTEIIQWISTRPGKRRSNTRK